MLHLSTSKFHCDLIGASDRCDHLSLIGCSWITGCVSLQWHWSARRLCLLSLLSSSTAGSSRGASWHRFEMSLQSRRSSNACQNHLLFNWSFRDVMDWGGGCLHLLSQVTNPHISSTLQEYPSTSSTKGNFHWLDLGFQLQLLTLHSSSVLTCIDQMWCDPCT
jgi:hypothetical protein